MLNMYCLGELAAGKITAVLSIFLPYYKKQKKKNPTQTHFVFIVNDSCFDAICLHSTKQTIPLGCIIDECKSVCRLYKLS